MFNLSEPENWYCRFRFFNRALVIDVYQTGNPIQYEITFSVPTYIQCPMIWKGVNFRHVTEEELTSFRQRVSRIFSDKNYGTQELFIARVDLDTPSEKIVLIKAFRAAIRQRRDRSELF